MEIRPCTAADLEQLRMQWPTAGSDVHGAHHAAQANGEASYLVAWQGPTPMGSAMVQWSGCVGEHARAAHPGCVEINHLQVRADMRGQGVGTALILAAQRLAESKGCPEIGLGVAADNSAARRLYLRLGYEPTGIRDTTSYAWFDAHGIEHAVTEEDELLVKNLPSA